MGKYYLIPSTGYCQDAQYAPQWITTFFNDWGDCCRTGWIVESCLLADPENVPEEVVIVEAEPETATTTTTTTTTTTVVAGDDLETVPLRFSLMGLPVDIDDFGAFKESMTQELKIALTTAAEDIGMKIVALKSGYDLISSGSRSIFHRDMQSETQDVSSGDKAQTVNLYYDVDVVKDSQNYGPVLIQAIQDKHGEVLGDLQASSNYPPSNFDLCTTTRAGLYEDSDFDVCTLEHETVPIKFCSISSKLSPEVNQDDLTEELINIYSESLNGIRGLEVASLSVKSVDESSDALCVYLNADVIDYDDRNWKSIIDRELAMEKINNQILELVKHHLMDESAGRGANLEVCIDDEGLISTDCNTVKNQNLALPMWAIITIASVCGGIVLCIAISVCICAYQDNKDEQEMKTNIKSL
jgi:hypothetical protein